MELKANEKKSLEITVGENTYCRYAIKTHFVKLNEDYIDIIDKYVKPVYEEGDKISISEKMIALCQNRVVYKDELHVGFWAKFLSRFASKSTAGQGVNNTLKMAYCIQKTGLLKTIYAAICSAIGKIFGKKGIFYKIVGRDVAGLDGFYSNVFEEYGNYGIENPDKPYDVCREIEEKTKIPCMIVDANDLGQDLLGYSPKMKQELTEQEMLEIIKDNPAGQGKELTPIILIRKKDNIKIKEKVG